MTQKQRILDHLESGRTITPIGALNRFGCFRLAARIAELRQDGHDIRTEKMTRIVDGKTVASHARYRLRVKP